MKPSQKPVKVDEKDTTINHKKRIRYVVDDPNNVIGDFERYVRSKYGFTKGIIGKEVLEAISSYLALNDFGQYKHKSLDTFQVEGHAHTQFVNKNHEALASILDDSYSNGDEVSFDDIRAIISTEFNRIDGRTHKSYVDALVSRKILIEIGNKYSSYYYLELPELSDIEKKAMDLTLSKTQRLILNEIPDEGIQLQKLSIAVGIRTAKLKPHLTGLEEKDLIWSPAAGKFKPTDLGCEVR